MTSATLVGTSSEDGVDGTVAHEGMVLVVVDEVVLEGGVVVGVVAVIGAFQFQDARLKLGDDFVALANFQLEGGALELVFCFDGFLEK